MAKGCKFDGCHYLANESDYCPRHDLLIQAKGLEAVQDEAFGKACTACGVRYHDRSVLATCPECEQKDVCVDCRHSESCCFGDFGEEATQIALRRKK